MLVAAPLRIDAVGFLRLPPIVVDYPVVRNREQPGPIIFRDRPFILAAVFQRLAENIADQIVRIPSVADPEN